MFVVIGCCVCCLRRRRRRRRLCVRVRCVVCCSLFLVVVFWLVGCSSPFAAFCSTRVFSLLPCLLLLLVVVCWLCVCVFKAEILRHVDCRSLTWSVLASGGLLSTEPIRVCIVSWTGFVEQSRLCEGNMAITMASAPAARLGDLVAHASGLMRPGSATYHHKTRTQMEDEIFSAAPDCTGREQQSDLPDFESRRLESQLCWEDFVADLERKRCPDADDLYDLEYRLSVLSGDHGGGGAAAVADAPRRVVKLALRALERGSKLQRLFMRVAKAALSSSAATCTYIATGRATNSPNEVLADCKHIIEECRTTLHDARTAVDWWDLVVGVARAESGNGGVDADFWESIADYIQESIVIAHTFAVTKVVRDLFRAPAVAHKISEKLRRPLFGAVVRLVRKHCKTDVLEGGMVALARLAMSLTWVRPLLLVVRVSLPMPLCGLRGGGAGGGRSPVACARSYRWR